MKVYVGKQGREVLLSRDTVLARGGEAVVHIDPYSPQTSVLKVYHQPHPLRARKLEWFMKQQFNLLNAVVPEELVYSKQQEVIGFQMKRLDNSTYYKLSCLFKRSFCADHQLTTFLKTILFGGYGEDLCLYHSFGIVGGDLNDGNQMFNPDPADLSRAWIDVDSWQLSKDLPCVANTRLYVHPDLYDATTKQLFEPRHDWWSYCVLLFRGLLNGVHPFKSGIHPQFTSYTERAKRGITILDDEVESPSVGLSPDILSDDLIDALLNILKQKEDIFPLDVLRSYSEALTECPSCGVGYSTQRPLCPSCAQKTIVDVQLAQRFTGIELTDLVRPAGRIVFYKLQGDKTLCVASEKKGIVVYTHNDDQSSSVAVLPIHHTTGSVYDATNEILAVCPDPLEEEPNIYLLRASPSGVEKVKSLTTVSLAGGEAVFSCSSRFIYRIAGRMLLCGEVTQSNHLLEHPVTQVFERQTWFTVASVGDEEVIVGYDRRPTGLDWFLIRGDGPRTLTRYDIKCAALEQGETLLDTAVYFARTYVLVVRRVRQRGVEAVRLEVIKTLGGEVISSHNLLIDKAEEWDVIQGKAFSGRYVTHASAHGVVVQDLKDMSVVEVPNSSQYVSVGDELTRVRSGQYLLRKDDRLLHVEIKKET